MTESNLETLFIFLLGTLKSEEVWKPYIFGNFVFAGYVKLETMG
jgi:hypothetical protein